MKHSDTWLESARTIVGTAEPRAGEGMLPTLTQRGASFAVIPAGQVKLPPAYDQPHKMTGSKRKPRRETSP